MSEGVRQAGEGRAPHEAGSRRRQMARLRLSRLAEVSTLVGSTLDLDEVLGRVMRAAQEVMQAEKASIMLLDERTGELAFALVVGDGPEVVPTHRRGARTKLGQGISGLVAQTGVPLLVPDVRQSPHVDPRADPATAFTARSILCAPLQVEDRLIGVAHAMDPLRGGSFSRQDLDLFAAFCRQVAVAIDNARLHRVLLERQRDREQLAVAAAIQRSFLPEGQPPLPPGYRLEAETVPAAPVGGDLYDFLDLPGGRVAILVGDVAGKGVPAALFMAKLLSDLRFLAQRHVEPTPFLEALNRHLAGRAQRGMFVTLSSLFLEPAGGAVLWVNAGHLPLLRYCGARGTVEIVEGEGGPPLGILPAAAFPAVPLVLAPGDALLLVTDGVLERRNRGGERFGMQRACEALARGGGGLAPLLAAVGAFGEGTEPQDDVTAVRLARDGADP